MDWTTIRLIAIWTAAIITAALSLDLLLSDPLFRLYREIYYFLN